jgi:hypothetical protein
MARGGQIYDRLPVHTAPRKKAKKDPGTDAGVLSRASTAETLAK